MKQTTSNQNPVSDDSHGTRKRELILQSAADLSTAVGLHSLSFSQVAGAVGLTKAGVAAHFRSKEALQLAVVDRVAKAYLVPLAQATAMSAPGLERLCALSDAWFQHLQSIPYRGGCFFAAAAQAFAGIPGAVRERIAHHTRSLLLALEEQAELASRLGEIKPAVDPNRLVFQIHALTQEANLRRELLDESDAFTQAHQALVELLTSMAGNSDNIAVVTNILQNDEVPHATS